MRIWETSEAFPFRTLRALGVVILLHGIILIGLGIVDVIWTVIKYTDDYDNCPLTDWPSRLENPCDNDELVWTWVAEGIWGGFLIILVGVLGLMFSRWRVKNLRFQRDMFGVGCILLGFPICPAVIVVSVLEIYYGEGIFFYMDGNDLNTEDVVKFVIPLLVAIFAFLAWVVGIAGAVVACCANPNVQEVREADSMQGTLLYQKPQPRPMIMAQQPQQPLVVQAPAPQPIVVQPPPQPVPQPPQPMYEIVPIPQPAPPPYYVMGPHPAYGPPMGPPLPMGPPFGPKGPMMRPPFGRPPLPAIMPPPPMDPYM